MLEATAPVALVTGGATGIGEATSRLLHARGYRVVIVGRRLEVAQELAASLEGSIAVRADVSDSSSIDAAVDAAVERFGRLDVAVTCAGVDDPETKAVLGEQMASGSLILRTPDLPDEAWRKQMSINLDGTFFTIRAALRAMLPRHAGAIVTVASGAAYEAIPGYANYVTSKAGVVALTQSVGKEMIGHGIRVNGVAPGLVSTPMLSRAPSGLKKMPSAHPHRVMAAPEEIASVIGFLISEDAVNLAGEVIIANGGRATA